MRAAVEEANALGSASVFPITFGVSGTISLASALEVSVPVSIDGSGQSVVIDGGGATNLFVFDAGYSLSFLTLQNGLGSPGRAGAVTAMTTSIKPVATSRWPSSRQSSRL